jgi:5-methylcytosine-specific restriction enzyme subunit McrC
MFLPVMKSDITLSYGSKTLIIDTKYYSHTMQSNPMFNSAILNSQNLYQIFYYVKNKDKHNTGNVSGCSFMQRQMKQLLPIMIM